MGGSTKKQILARLRKIRRVYTQNATDFKTETCFGTLEPTRVQPTRAPLKIPVQTYLFWSSPLSKNPVQTCLFWFDQEMECLGAFGLNRQPISNPKPVSEPLSLPKSSPNTPPRKFLSKHVCPNLIKIWRF